MGKDCLQIWAILPELWLALLGLVLVVVAGWVRPRWRPLPLAMAIGGLLTGMALTARMLPWPAQAVFCGTYAVDPFGSVFKLMIQSGALIALLLLWPYFGRHPQAAQAPPAVLFATLGGMGVACALDLVLIMLFLQMLSLASYLLVALLMGSRPANEAALKFFLYAAAALAVMGYGMSFLYGLTGHLDLPTIGSMLREGRASPWILFSAGLILVGFAFEATLVPFHFWAPDVYQGSTAPVAGFLSVVPKIACFAGLLRFLQIALPGESIHWPALTAALSAATMTWGNLAALRQTRLKRLLAYSSIAQAGYVLMAVAVAARTDQGSSAAGYYLAVFVFMNLGAFAVTAQVERAVGTDQIAAFRGLARRAPWAALAMALCLLSLAGIPPLAGFAGKVLLLNAALAGGLAWLAIVGILNMALSLYYYVGVAAQMYFKPAPLNAAPLPAGKSYAPAMVVCLAGTIVPGLAPEPLLRLVQGLVDLFR